MKKIIIAIDGHSSTGKSTLAKQLGNALQYNYISTGDMYRAVTLYFIENEVDINDLEAVTLALSHIKIHFENDGSGTNIFLNNKNVQEEIRKMYVSNRVSPVAKIREVRAAMVKQQRKIGEDKGLVMDGRDIGTVVFPQAELKIFLTAAADVRAKRRFDELIAKGQEVNLEDVTQNIINRDRIDSTRKISPLKKAEDAVILDNTNLHFEEQLKIALKWAEERIHPSVSQDT